MKREQWLLALAIVATAACSAPLAVAQEKGVVHTEESRAQVLVKVNGLAEKDILGRLNDMLRAAEPEVNVAYDPARGIVLLVGESNAVQRAQTLIDAFEQRVQEQPLKTMLFSIPGLGPSSARVLEMIAPEGVQVEPDFTAGVVAARGYPEGLNAFAHALNELDSAQSRKRSAAPDVTELLLDAYVLEGRVTPPGETRRPRDAIDIILERDDNLDRDVEISLDNRGIFDCEDCMLSTALQRLSEKSRIDIQPSWTCLENAGVDPEQVVFVDLTKPASYRKILSMIMEQATSDAVFYPDDGLLRVTARCCESDESVEQVYPIQDLLAVTGGDPVQVLQELDRLVRFTVFPPGWEECGGATLKTYGGVMILNAPPYIQADVQNLLDALRQSYTPPPAPRQPLPPNLAEVGKVLADQGFTHPTLAAQFSCRMPQQGDSALDSNAIVDGRRLRFRLRPRDIVTANNVVEFTADVDVDIRSVSGGAASPNSTLQLETRIAAPLDKYTVLASSPGSGGPNQALAIVLRLREAPTADGRTVPHNEPVARPLAPSEAEDF